MNARLWMALAITGTATAGLAGACSSDVGTDTNEGGAGPTTTTTTTTTTSSHGGGGSGGEAGGTSCANAIDYATAADPGTGYAEGAIEAEGQAIYYRVTLQASTFWILEANSPGLDEHATDYLYADWLDPVITLYSEDGSTTIAQIDDSFPRSSTDARLLYRAPADPAQAVYCVKVEDWGSWAGAVRAVPTNNAFEFGVLTPTPDAEGNVFDADPNETVAQSQLQTYAPAATGNSLFTSTFGGLDTQADVDVYTITVPTGIAGIDIGDFSPRSGPGAPGTGVNGTNGSGSTIELGLVNLTDAAGTQIIAQLDATRPAERSSSRSIFAPITPGTYHLFVQRNVGSTAGANDFYDLSQVLLATEVMYQTEHETTTGDNDTSALAEIPDAVTPAGPNPQYAFIGYMNTVADVDFWRFPATAGNQIAVSCTSARSGSGVINATFEVRAPNGTTVLEDETETEDADVWWYTGPDAQGSKPGITVGTTGNHYLRVSATGQKGNVSSNHYFCVVTEIAP